MLGIEPRRTLEGDELDDALTVVADFIDLKTPYMSGHSRRCAQHAADASAALWFTDASVAALRRAALVHEIGTTVVPISIWDKPGRLTRAEFDHLELHPMLTEQMLRRSPALSLLAATHHERADGPGYHKGLRTGVADTAACVLAASDVYVGLTADRADRPALSAEDAAAELRGLTGREAEVLRLAARGLTPRAIADQLYISRKTADHHIQHVYSKIGASTRAAAALWAMQRAILN